VEEKKGKEKGKQEEEEEEEEEAGSGENEEWPPRERDGKKVPVRCCFLFWLFQIQNFPTKSQT
jgi:hypothetical protein